MTARAGKRKTGQKSLRISAESQFAIEVAAALEEQSETAFIEAACKEKASTVLSSRGLRLRSLFHPHPGVRRVNLYLLDGFPLSDVDHALRAFVLEHAAFFLRESGDEAIPNVANIRVLWPADASPDIALARYIELQSDDYWGPGKAMSSDLRAAGIEPPTWPPAP